MTGVEKLRDTQILFLSGLSSSSDTQGMPLSSCKVRKPTTPIFCLTQLSEQARKSAAVIMLRAFSMRAQRRPMPQTSPTSVAARAVVISVGSVRFATPCLLGFFLARRLAIFANVLLLAMPMDTGIPVHCATCWRSRYAKSTGFIVSGRLLKSRKHSSMLYISMAGAAVASTCITRLLISP